jgi:hypothetical protein
LLSHAQSTLLSQKLQKLRCITKNADCYSVPYTDCVVHVPCCDAHQILAFRKRPSAGCVFRYLKRVEDVLGKGWKEQRGGKELYNDGESFRKKLDTQVRSTHTISLPPTASSALLGRRSAFSLLSINEFFCTLAAFADCRSRAINHTSCCLCVCLFFSAPSCALQVLFEKWSNHVQKLKPGPSGHVFDIDLKRGEGATALVLSVNFHPSIITISKEVRNLKALGFRVPLVIVNKALQANHLYPFAISLKASIKTYQQTLDKLRANPVIRDLVAKYYIAVQKKIEVGVTMRWESYKLEEMTKQLAESVFELQDKVCVCVCVCVCPIAPSLPPPTHPHTHNHTTITHSLTHHHRTPTALG